MADGLDDPVTSASGAGATPGFWPAGDAAPLLDAKEFVVPVLGAGIGLGPGGMPSTWDIANHLASTFDPEAGDYSDPSDLNKVADETSAAPIQLQECVAAFVDSYDPHPTTFTRALVHLPSKFIITFSYDRLLELSAEEEGVEYESLLNDEDGLKEAVDRLTDLDPAEKLTMLHLHGRTDWPEGIVLDGSSYQKLANRANFDNLVFTLVKLKTMCFIGTTLNEFHVRYHMRANRGRRTHVLLCKADEEPRLTDGPNGITYKRDGIIVCPYPDHQDLDGFAEKLAAVTRAPILSTPVALPRTATAQTHALPFGYVPNVLYERGHWVGESDRIAAAVLGRDYGPESFSEADVAQGQRTLLLGAPGSGKSELLRRAGELVPAEEFPVLIRSANLDTDPGDALTVLQKAAQQGVGLRGDVVVNLEALRRRRFHFFLDGLDEKPVSQQERLAELIVDLADAFPQHRFTVATRPVDAVKAFPRATEEEAVGWVILDVAPDRAWQARYLEAAGVGLDELEGRMPALRDLRGLLQLPFFLAKTIELEKDGRLGRFEDLWALVQGLVTATLERELGIALPEAEIRAWLRNVALTMHLAGRTALTLREIEQIEIPQEAGRIVGSAKDIAEALILRFLLLESEGSTALPTGSLVSPLPRKRSTSFSRRGRSWTPSSLSMTRRFAASGRTGWFRSRSCLAGTPIGGPRCVSATLSPRHERYRLLPMTMNDAPPRGSFGRPTASERSGLGTTTRLTCLTMRRPSGESCEPRTWATWLKRSGVASTTSRRRFRETLFEYSRGSRPRVLSMTSGESWRTMTARLSFDGRPRSRPETSAHASYCP